MKIIFDNVKNNYLVKYAFVIFVIQCIFGFYNSIRLDSIDLLISGIVENTYKFLNDRRWRQKSPSFFATLYVI